MNFLAHYLLATQYFPPVEPVSLYIVGNALPDLLPLASARLSMTALRESPHPISDNGALTQGATIHLLTDAAFHRLGTFRGVQEEISSLISEARFTDIRVRRFFFAHILTELALDSALLRHDRQLAEGFYSAFKPPEITAAAKWSENTLRREIPTLPFVLARFERSRYLNLYMDNAGVAEGLNRLCARAKQDTFEGANAERLIDLAGRAISAVSVNANVLMDETAEATRLAYLPTTSK